MKKTQFLLPIFAFLFAISAALASVTEHNFDPQDAQGFDPDEGCISGLVDEECSLSGTGSICKMIGTNIDAKDPNPVNCQLADVFRQNTP